jgi:hypothetical protein
LLFSLFGFWGCVVGLKKGTDYETYEEEGEFFDGGFDPRDVERVCTAFCFP